MSERKTSGVQHSLRLMKRSLGYFLPYKKRIMLGVMGMLVVAPCAAASAWLVKLAVDDVLIKKDMLALQMVTLGVIGLMTLKGVFRFIQVYYMNTAGLYAINDIRKDLYGRIMCLPMSFFNDTQVGMLMSRILNDVGLVRSSLPSLIMLIREVFSVIGLTFYVFYLDWQLAFWGVLVMPAALYPFITFSKRLRKLSRMAQSTVSDVSVLIQEGLSGIKVIKGFATESRESKRFDGETHKNVEVARKQIRATEQSSRIMEIIGSFAAGLVLWYGGTRVINGDLTSGALLSFLTSLALLYEPIKRINASNIDLQMALTGAERVFEIMDMSALVSEKGGERTLDEPFRELAFENVTFSYDGTPRPALENLDLVVKAGERVAIVGASGSGKSTLANLLPRFFDPQEGRITLNGHPLKEYDLKSLRRATGMVAQDTFLFNATVAENIAYGATRDYSPEEIQAAAKAAYAHDFILELPEGYETMVGERGVKLSGGQKQRLTIARAILKNPPLLVLDEATSALDTESERIVQLALENLMLSRTSVVIAHRLSTILTADRIVVMDNGRIIDQGPHAALLTRCEIYQRLYEMQYGCASPD
ncbi:ABC transporter ATP-binding protein [Humidesulfovibrio sp.]|uniref:ABC transporter ATP-binding protein n=1 Tax=Humidesulfovibrio sp. TaxID=2910988 RepID=UPI00280B885B|nr:ABC transporter transmembrane domain-containing protein [Humidesulfovibrio sp.]